MKNRVRTAQDLIAFRLVLLHDRQHIYFLATDGCQHRTQRNVIFSALWPIYLMPYTFTVLVTVLVSMHRYCTVCKPTMMACARISASAVTASRTQSRFFPSNAPQARHRVAVLALFSVIYNIPRFFEYEPPINSITAY